MMLRSSPRLIEPLRAWSRRELERQDSLDYPELGHDIVTGEERAVSEAQLDVLASAENLGTVGLWLRKD